MASKYITRAAVVKMLREKAKSLENLFDQGIATTGQDIGKMHAYERAADLVETFNDAEAEEVESWEIFAQKYGPAIQLMRSRIGLKE